MNCKNCGRLLTWEEAALTKKLINRGCREFYCLSCLAEHFQVGEEVLREKIRYYKSIGCTLFTEDPPDTD